MEAPRSPNRERLILSNRSFAPEIVDELRSIHALKSGALAMFDPMLAAVASQRDDQSTSAEVAELLGRMHSAFSNHRNQTAEHERRLAARLIELGSSPARGRVGAFSAGARAWVRASGLRGQNHGANARNAFVFESLEVASLNLLAQVADRSGDEKTASLARDCIAEDKEMAETINRNWTNVLTLKLAI